MGDLFDDQYFVISSTYFLRLKFVLITFPEFSYIKCTVIILMFYAMSSVGEWLGCSLAVLEVDGSSLLTASQRCDGLNYPYA